MTRRGTTYHESAIRLTLLDALSAAADEITRELAPGSVELRLRSGEPEFVATPAPTDEPVGPAGDAAPPPPPDIHHAAIASINLLLAEQLRPGSSRPRPRERLSLNSWLVRAGAAALAGDDRGGGARRGGRVGQSYTGWVR